MYEQSKAIAIAARQWGRSVGEIKNAYASHAGDERGTTMQPFYEGTCSGSRVAGSALRVNNPTAHADCGTKVKFPTAF